MWLALWVFTIEMKRSHMIPMAEETGQGLSRGQGVMEEARVLPVRVGGARPCAAVAWGDVCLYICLPAPEDRGPLPTSAPEDGGLPQHLLRAWITASPRSTQPHLEGGVGRRKKPASPREPCSQGWGEGLGGQMAGRKQLGWAPQVPSPGRSPSSSLHASGSHPACPSRRAVPIVPSHTGGSSGGSPPCRGQAGGTCRKHLLNGQGRPLSTPIHASRRCPEEAKTKRSPSTWSSRGGDKPWGSIRSPLSRNGPRRLSPAWVGFPRAEDPSPSLYCPFSSPARCGLPLLRRVRIQRGSVTAQGRRARERQCCLPHSQAATVLRAWGP